MSVTQQPESFQTHGLRSPHNLISFAPSSMISSGAANHQISSQLAEASRRIDHLTNQNSAILNSISDLGKRLDNSASYSIENGSFVSTSVLSTPNQQAFANLVRDQLLSVLPTFVEDLAKIQSKTNQQWARNELSNAIIQAVEEITSAAATPKLFSEKDAEATSEPGQDSQKFEIHSIDQLQSDRSLDSSSIATEFIRISRVSKSFKFRFGALSTTFCQYASGQASDIYTYRFQFQPAVFFIRTGLSVLGKLSFDPRGWPLVSPSISFFAIIPNDAEIYKFIWRGDIASIRHLFAIRKILPTDRKESSGSSYLEVFLQF